MFDKYNNYSGISTDLPGKINVFGMSNMIYFTPNA